jgi:hypothetical protein
MVKRAGVKRDNLEEITVEVVIGLMRNVLFVNGNRGKL